MPKKSVRQRLGKLFLVSFGAPYMPMFNAWFSDSDVSLPRDTMTTSSKETPRTTPETREKVSAPPSTPHVEMDSDGEPRRPNTGSTMVKNEMVVVPIEEEAQQVDVPVRLGWRSWVVVLVTCFAIFTQVFITVAAGSIVAFIELDMKGTANAAWIVQGPLLVQSVLSPIMGRLSDVVDRKYLAALPPVVAFIGAVVSAEANDMNMLIGGGILIGFTLPTIAIVQAIPSEILPLKLRPLASGLLYAAGSTGGIIGGLAAGAVASTPSYGWRWVFWIQAVLHGVTSLGLLLFYRPRRSGLPTMPLKQILWACDPIGSFLFVSGTTLILLALDWVGTYPSNESHVSAVLTFGCLLFLAFVCYEIRGRSDGLVAHVFFRKNKNFALSVLAFGIEGWIFFSALNSVTPQLVLYLGFEHSSWGIGLRQLSFGLTNIFVCAPVTWYATRFKDLKSPLLVTWVFFLAATISYACIQPSWNVAQIVLNVIAGIGQAGPLTLLVTYVQFTAPHAFLSTATGLAFSARAIGGAFGSAVLSAIVNGYISGHWGRTVSFAAMAAGMPPEHVKDLLEAMMGGHIGDPQVVHEGATTAVWSAAALASEEVYAAAYRLAWASIIPLVVVAMVCSACLGNVKDLMTDKIEATVERGGRTEDGPVGSGAESG